MLERKSSNRLFVRLVTLQEIMETLYVRRMQVPDASARAAGKIPLDQLAELRARIETLIHRQAVKELRPGRAEGRRPPGAIGRMRADPWRDPRPR